jgi:hypothetical protein
MQKNSHKQSWIPIVMFYCMKAYILSLHIVCIWDPIQSIHAFRISSINHLQV